MTAEGGRALLFVAFMQGRLQHQGLGVGRESGAHLLFSVGGHPSRLLAKEAICHTQPQGAERVTL